jgi:hypothetical protein
MTTKGHFESMQKGWRYALREKLTNANTKFPHSALTVAVLGKWQNWFLDAPVASARRFRFPLAPGVPRGMQSSRRW